MRRLVAAGVMVLVMGQPALLFAAVSASYKINESTLGGSGGVHGSSSSFKADSSTGTAAFNGGSSSTTYQTKGGYVTTSDPALSFSVTATNINFGTLSPSVTATATSTFSVIDYTSYGYIVQTVGPTPKSGSHALNPIAVTGPSQTGVEQFGLNLRANTSPTTFGADPSGGVGVVGAGYNTPNNFKYVDGGTIASSPKSSGQTNFTISYVANDSVNTPGGGYAGAITLVCTGTY